MTAPYGIQHHEPEPGWHLEAACNDLTDAEADRLFFPKHGKVTKPAMELCEPCPVRADCILAALHEPEARPPGRGTGGTTRGIWAALSNAELERLRHELRSEWGIPVPSLVGYDHLVAAPKAVRDAEAVDTLGETLEELAGDEGAVIAAVAAWRDGLQSDDEPDDGPGELMAA